MARRSLPVLPEGFADPKLPKGTFSHSQYGTYKKCPKAYEFQYVEGIRGNARAVMHISTAIHSGAEYAIKHMIEHKATPAIEEVRAKVADSFEEGKEGVDWTETEPEGRSKDHAVFGYTAYHLKALPTLNPVDAEALFVKKVGTVPVIGYIDLIDKPVNGGPTVADLKYTSTSWSQDDMDRDPQFTLYSLVTGISRVRVDNLVTLKAGPEYRTKVATRNDDHYRNLVEDYEETADFIKRGIFGKAPIDSWNCTEKWCNYYSLCRGRKS